MGPKDLAKCPPVSLTEFACNLGCKMQKKFIYELQNLQGAHNAWGIVARVVQPRKFPTCPFPDLHFEGLSFLGGFGLSLSTDLFTYKKKTRKLIRKEV